VATVCFNDPILLLAITTTQFSSVAFAIPMLLGRGHRRGISTAAARALLVAPTAFLALFLPAIAPEFNTPITYLAAAACLVTAAAYNILLTRYPVDPPFRPRPRAVPGTGEATQRSQPRVRASATHLAAEREPTP
jgi:hypothetical protein